jgi:Ca2+-transporting ATPase
MGPTLKQSLSMVSRNPIHGPSPFPAWARSTGATLDHHTVQEKKGLSSEEVINRRRYYGYNELHKEERDSWWKLIWEQFEDTLVRILLLAALISFALAYFEDNPHAEEKSITAYIEPLVILLILVINAIVGVWQESNAENALEALKEMQSEHAKVLRDGQVVPDLPARELVPGDIVEIRVGDKVPADMRVLRLKTSTLRVEQASLTGESVAVLKSTHEVEEDEIELQVGVWIGFEDDACCCADHHHHKPLPPPVVSSLSSLFASKFFPVSGQGWTDLSSVG